MKKKYALYGMGNALVDIEFEVSDAFLQAHGITKGMMSLIDQATQSQLVQDLTASGGLKKRASGGSAANTVVAASQLGAKTFYACKIANDEAGAFYMHDLHAAGVATDLATIRAQSEGVTGTCLVMVTPDAERTMNTFLGITADFSSRELSVEALQQSEYLYIEGYLVTSDSARAAAIEARRLAAQWGVKTAMTFSDPAMVHFFKAGLAQMLDDGVDVLFCNQEEAIGFTQTANLAEAIVALLPLARKLVITLGAQGAVVIDAAGEDYTLTKIEPTPTEAVDTNGAGDMFAGAFLYGLIQGWENEQAGELASRAAAAVVGRFGARLTEQEIAAL